MRTIRLAVLAALGDRETRRDRQDPAACAEQRFEADVMREALLRLPVRQRDLLVLHEYEGLGIEDIAQLQGSTPGAVRVRLCRARRKLKDIALAMLEERR
jgi:RNA polymerase sigma-70 factor (ECF subfamily)